MLPLYLHPQITGYEQNHAAFPLKENPYKAAQNPQQTSLSNVPDHLQHDIVHKSDSAFIC